ncbi:MAG: trypsin-like peptidase domain-containing protein [Candidatus Brocadiae bacterium]|nr:trypsin-like peptidase domain-containing protein [Candidatus Brocadiia bacterium]
MKLRPLLTGLVAGLLLANAPRTTWCGETGLALKDRVALCKAATALVEVAQGSRVQGTGSAFCVHEAGLFVTNRHVLLTRRPRSPRDDMRKIPLVKRATLVLSPSEAAQQEVKAEVLRVSDDFDLALLRAEGMDRVFSRLTLGSVDDLMETAEVLAFGFPFGKALAVNRDSYPSISVNAGRITSLRRKEGVLDKIQVDVVLNPGNSGGPVLDAQGKVIGVVVSGIVGMGVNFAIPVSKVRRFLSRPEILFTPPPLKQATQHLPVEFRARVVSLLSPRAPMILELILETGDSGRHRYDMTLQDGVHRVIATPVPRAKGPLVVRLTATYSDGEVNGDVEDRCFRIGERQVKLSEIRSLKLGAPLKAELHSGDTLRGAVVDLGVVPIAVGGQWLRCKLDRAREIDVVRPEEVDAVTFTIVARSAGKEAGRLTASVYIEGVAREPVYPAMAQGRFLRPSRSATPTSYLQMVSSKGDWIGQGQTYSYDGAQLQVRRNSRGVTVMVDGWHADFGAPMG